MNELPLPAVSHVNPNMPPVEPTYPSEGQSVYKGTEAEVTDKNFSSVQYKLTFNTV